MNPRLSLYFQSRKNAGKDLGIIYNPAKILRMRAIGIDRDQYRRMPSGCKMTGNHTFGNISFA